MSTVVGTLTYADVPGFPAGTVVDHVVVSVSDTSVSPPTSTSQNVPPGTTSVTFADLDAGSYTFQVSAVDSSGVALGTPITGSFTVTAPATVTLNLPSAASFTQQ
jgi:hypothetical protein